MGDGGRGMRWWVEWSVLGGVLGYVMAGLSFRPVRTTLPVCSPVHSQGPWLLPSFPLSYSSALLPLGRHGTPRSGKWLADPVPMRVAHAATHHDTPRSRTTYLP